MAEEKLTLPAFLKVLVNGNMQMQKAMTVAAKVFKAHNTTTALGNLTDAQLKTLGVESKEDRKAALAAFRKAGYKPSATVKPRAVGGGSIAQTSNVAAGPSTLGKKSCESPRKRKRDDDLNRPLPSGPSTEGVPTGSFDFNENLDEEILRTKSAVVNRAPVMSVWATIVAERLGFKREEALSIASAYTEMNAISKGVSIGIFEQSKGKGIQIENGQSQPYVDLMGRRALYETKHGEWRALMKGEPVDPDSAFSYVSRAFRQTLPFVAGAMRLLASTFAPVELNEKGFGLYAEFRPDVNGWGKRAEIRCETILGLRKPPDQREVHLEKPEDTSGGQQFVTYESSEHPDQQASNADKEPPAKRAKAMTIEEYEAVLDSSFDYDELSYIEEY